MYDSVRCVLMLMLVTLCIAAAAVAGQTDLAVESADLTLWNAHYVKAVGDLNGDGRADLLLDVGWSRWGVFFGRPLAGGPITVDLLAEPPDVTLFDYEGFLNADIADVTGDKIDDLLLLTDDGSGGGVLHLIEGREEWPAEIRFPFNGTMLTISGLAGSWYGPEVATGDVDGNGVADILIGAPGAKCPRVGGLVGGGAVFAIWKLPARHTVVSDPYAFADGMFCHPCFSSGASDLECPQFGAVLEAGDFDGDGHDDLVVGSPFRGVKESHQGFAHVFLSKRHGRPFPHRTDVGYGTVGDMLFVGASEEFHTPRSLVAGDLNHDGYDDLAILTTDSYRPDTGVTRRYGGDLRLFLGGPGRFDGSVVEFDSELGDWNLFGNPEPRLDKAAMGDVDGDGITDLL
ncbi:MAG: FG-GAP repeat protein, partial [Acidobacteria bacterium]|nr:FG-GAP repeat protein [Candidatus Polarisedimenticola svalbardensis]